MIKVIGSVHVLICSCYGDDVIHIWNPSLSIVSTLPSSSNSSRGNDISYGVGYDPNTDDHKVVKISKPFWHVLKEWLQVEVYSMRKGSWEFVTQSFPSHVTRILKSGYVCTDGHDGHLHWLGYIDEEVGRQTILTFDLDSETFREIPLPDFVVNGKRRNVLGVFGGNLCVTSRAVIDGVCGVWVMDEYGVAESWVKHHIFLEFSCDVAFGFTLDNEFLFGNEHHCLALCHRILLFPR